MIDWLIYALYRFVGAPLAVGVVKTFGGLFSSKLQEIVLDRSAQNLQALPARPIWVHAASGEIEYAKSVIRELKEEFPQIPILVTYFSPSAKKLIQKFPGIDLAMALPWDRPEDLERFLNYYQPRVCLIARTDVWPEMARQLKKRKIPTALFAATLASESSRSGILSGALTRTALNSLSKIFCVSAEDQDNLKALGVKVPVEISGDTRFDQVLYRLQNPGDVRMELKPASTDRVFVCGSTWPQDEEVLFNGISKWLARGGRVIIAPHEIAEARIASIEQQLKARNWSVQKYSDRTTANWSTQILIVNHIGSLQEIYRWGQVAFVGGSFKDKVHSVMEPLCLGIPVCVGPHHLNNREALQFQHVILGTSFFAVNVIQNSSDLETVLDKCWALATPHPVIAQKVRSASGSTHKIVEWAQEFASPV